MRPIPAQRIGYAHGLLSALEQRGKLRIEEFGTEFPAGDLFPPDLENPTGRTRQLVSYARAAGLVREERGAVELTDLGKRYLQSGDPADVFAVSAAQAEWLRRQLREKHLTESIWTGAAIALSLYASVEDAEPVAPQDVGRAAAHLGRAGWDDEQTFRSQGERLTQLLEDMQLIGPDGRPTGAGRATIGELRLPEHPPLRELAAQLHPQADPPLEQSIAAPEDEAEDDAPEWAEAPPAPTGVIAGPDEPTRAYPVLGVAAEGTAGSSVSEAAAPMLPAEEPTAREETVMSESGSDPAAPPPEPKPGFQSGIRPALTALRPEDLANWKATQEAAEVEKARAQPREAAGAPFLDPADVREAAERRGLVIDPAVYAAAIAALASGRHLVLTGGAGSGKTSLALAIAEAAVKRGRCRSVLFTSAGAGLRGSDTLGRAPRDGGAFQPGLVPRAIEGDQWLVIDELDRAKLDRALGAVSTVLGGQAVDLPGGAGELSPPPGWRMIATMADIEQVGRTTPALRRRFVFVEVPVLERADLETLVGAWAGDDDVAAAVGRRLVAINDVIPLGPALYRDAVAYVKARRTLSGASEDDLTIEALAGFVLPQLEGQGDEVAARAVRAAGFES